MLIRNQQLEEFRKVAIGTYENDVVTHLKSLAPKLCEIRGEATVRRVVRMGIARAQDYGFTTRGPVRLYIDLMFTLGVDFDTDPQLPWAAAALKDPSLEEPPLRAEALYESYQQYRSAVAGPNDEYLRDALRKVRQAQIEERTNSAYEDGIAAGLQTIYPQKADHLGAERLRQFVALGRRSAASFSIASYSGVALLTGLMFGFGHGVATDPLYPWVGAALNDPLVEDPAGRVARLRDKTMVYVDRLIDNLES